jgi:arginyl-tRNA synthetase
MLDFFKIKIKQSIFEIFKDKYEGIVGGVEIKIEVNNLGISNFGDFSINAFQLKRLLNKQNIIDDCAYLEQNLKLLEERTEWPFYSWYDPKGFFNFNIAANRLAEVVLTEIFNNGNNYGKNNLGNGKKVLIEYPSQNTHKEFHIGHVRNVCIGNTLVELYKKSGYNIIPINYINDFGAHVVKCLWYLQKFHREAELPENKQKWLGQIYAEASNYVKEHPEVQSELDEFQNKLEAHDPSVWKLFEETRQWSIDGFATIYRDFGVNYDAIWYESEVKERGQEIVDELLEKKVAEVGEKGALIVDLSKYKLDIVLLRKATGAGLYVTSDLALAEKKFNSYDIEESINITGIEQNFYFKQLFKVLELSGFHKKMTHIGYGLVSRPDGKMSSRLGNVILYEDLRDDIYEQLYQASKERHADWSEEKLKDTVWKLTMAALKFTMQKHEAAKNIAFDMKEAVSFEGYSAPYVLYVIARINSLLRRSTVDSRQSTAFDKLKELEEKKILLLLAEYSEVIKKALENYNPSVIAKYCFDLAQAFNEFYNKQSILDVEEKLSLARLNLCEAVKQVLTSALGLLTIEAVEEM